MTNVELLKQKFADSGYKLQYIADQLGMTRQALYNRLISGSDFNATEIMTLTKLLKLSNAEQKAIFFCLKSSHYVNK